MSQRGINTHCLIWQTLFNPRRERLFTPSGWGVRLSVPPKDASECVCVCVCVWVCVERIKPYEHALHCLTIPAALLKGYMSHIVLGWPASSPLDIFRTHLFSLHIPPQGHYRLTGMMDNLQLHTSGLQELHLFCFFSFPLAGCNKLATVFKLWRT